MRIPFRPNIANLARAAAALLLLLGILALSGFLLGPGLLKGKLERTLSGFLHRRTTIGTVRLDPFLLELELGDIAVLDTDGTPLLSAERLVLDFEGASLSSRTPLLSGALCVRPHLHLVRRGPGVWNVGDILRSWSEDTGPPPPFVLNALAVEGARVDLLDAPSGRSYTLDDGSLHLPFLSTLPSDTARPASLRVSGTASGAPFRAKGRWTPWDKDPHGSLEVAFSQLAIGGLPPDGISRVPAEFVGGDLSGSLRAEVAPGSPSGAVARWSTELTLSAPRSGDGRAVRPSASLRGDGIWHLTTGEARGRAEVDCADLDIPKLIETYSLRTPLRIASGRAEGHMLASGSRGETGGLALALSGDFTLRDLGVAERGAAPFLEIPRADLRLAESDPFSGPYALESVDLEKPRFRAEADWRGQVTRLARTLGAKGAGGGTSPEIVVRRVHAHEGRVTFEEPPGPEDLLTDLGSVDLALGPISTAAAVTASFDLAASTTYGTRVGISGTLAPAGGPIRGEFRVEELPLVRAAYLFPEGVPLTVRDGVAEMTGRFRADPSSVHSGIAVSDGRLRIRSFVATALSGAELIAVPELDLDGLSADLGNRCAGASRIVCRGGRLHLQRDAESRWNLRPPAVGPVSAAAGPASAWSLAADSLEIIDGRVEFEDWSLDEPAALSTKRFDMWVRDLSSARCATAGLGLDVEMGDGGRVGASGSAGWEPMRGEVDVVLKDLPLTLLQPYVAERMNVEVQEGTLSSSGHLTAADPQNGQGNLFRYDGDLLLARFRIVDRERWEDLLVWDTLHLGRVTLSSVPPRVIVGEAALSDFYARAVIMPDATLNIFHLWKASSRLPPGEVGNREPATARFEQMVVQNGTVDFTDRFIRPSYSASVRELTGRLSGFDSNGGTAGDIEMRGRLGGGAPLEVAGMANPFKKDLFADIRAACRGVDLLPFSAYAGKYAGYSIAGGKLDMEVIYRMENRHLEAQSRIFLDQFTLGEKVQGEGTPGLPLKLAVSLLKNQRGEIRVEMPISGSMDDLKLDFKPLVKKMVKSAVAKALAAPFTFLGRIFRRGPDLSFVPFQTGRAEMGAGGAETVASAGAKLAARPGLRVRIAGLFEPQADAEGLKRAILERHVRAEKVADLRRRGLAGDAAAPQTPSEYEGYLRAFFDSQEIPKPRGEDGRPKSLSPDEMEKLLLAYTEVGLGELRRLALDRAEAVRAAFLAAGARADQVYLVDPDSLPGADRDGLRTHAVFALE